MVNDKATVDNVKIVFFDVLAKQISSLIQLKEKLSTATEDKFDELSNEYESQFNLLKDTLSNVESLMSNVERFDTGSKDSATTIPNVPIIPTAGETESVVSPVVPDKEVTENTVSSVVPGEEIDDGDFDEPTPDNKFIPEKSTEDNSTDIEVSPLIPVSPSFEKATEDLIKNYNLSLDNVPSDDDKPKDEEKEEDEPKPVSLVPENILADIKKEEKPTEDVEQAPEEKFEDTEIDEEEEEKPTLVNLQEEAPVADTKEKVVLDKCIKVSDKQTKAIVVNAQQLEKLRSSREEETNRLDFGVVLSEPDTNTSIGTDEIEKLLQQANDLYKQGRAIEAEKIYQRIRELNKT